MTGFLSSRWFSRDATIRFALGVYLFALIFPAIHELSEGSGGPCTHCKELRLAGPVLLANCGGDCHDPSHHHHHGHDHSNCAICHAARAAETPATLLTMVSLSAEVVSALYTLEATLASAGDCWVYPIRGPPAAPTSI